MHVETLILIHNTRAHIFAALFNALHELTQRRRTIEDAGPKTITQYNLVAYTITEMPATNSGRKALHHHYATNTTGNNAARISYCLGALLRVKSPWSAGFWMAAIDAWFADTAVRGGEGVDLAGIFGAVLEHLKGAGQAVHHRVELGFNRVLALGPSPLINDNGPLVMIRIRFHCAGRAEYRHHVDVPVEKIQNEAHGGQQLGPSHDLRLLSAAQALTVAPWTCTAGETMLHNVVTGSPAFDTVDQLALAVEAATNICHGTMLHEVVPRDTVTRAFNMHRQHGRPVWAVPTAKKPQDNLPKDASILRCAACHAHQTHTAPRFADHHDHHRYNEDKPVVTHRLNELVTCELARDLEAQVACEMEAMSGMNPNDWF